MADLTPRLRKAAENSSATRYTLRARILHLLGRGETRVQKISAPLHKVDELEETDGRRGRERERRTSSILRTREEEVSTFPRDPRGRIVAPLGGPRGYVAGALREAARIRFGAELRRRDSPAFGLLGRLQGVLISPDLVPLGRRPSNPPASPYRTLIVTRRGTAMFEFFDLVREVPVSLDLQVVNRFPEGELLALLALAERLGIGPKRRGRLAIDRVVRRGPA